LAKTSVKHIHTNKKWYLKEHTYEIWKPLPFTKYDQC
jgi:hypothetical protein